MINSFATNWHILVTLCNIFFIYSSPSPPFQLNTIVTTLHTSALKKMLIIDCFNNHPLLAVHDENKPLYQNARDFYLSRTCMELFRSLIHKYHVNFWNLMYRIFEEHKTYRITLNSTS